MNSEHNLTILTKTAMKTLMIDAFQPSSPSNINQMARNEPGALQFVLLESILAIEDKVRSHLPERVTDPRPRGPNRQPTQIQLLEVCRVDLAALTNQQAQTAIVDALDSACSGIFVDLLDGEDFAAPPDLALRAEAKLPRLVSLALQSRFPEGLALADEIHTELASCSDHASDPYLSWSKHNAHAICLAGLSQSDEAEHQLALALIIADQAGNHFWRATTLLSVSRVQMQTGRPIESARTLATVIQLNASASHQAQGYSLMARLVEIQGQLDQAVSYRRTAIDHAPSSEPLFKLWIVAPQILSLIQQGDLAEAQSAVVMATELLRQCESPLYESIIRYLQALVLLEEGSISEALGVVESDDIAASQCPPRSYTNVSDGISLPLMRAKVLLANGLNAEALDLLDASQDSTSYLFNDARHCDLAAEACRRLGDWEQVTIYQQKALAAHRRSRGNVRGLLRLHRKHALATRTRRLNETLLTVQGQLLAVRSQHNELLDIASQDVMSPLTSLRLILHQLQQDPEIQHENLRLADPIDDALTRMSSLVPQLADLRDDRDPTGADGASHTNVEKLLGELVRSHQWASADKSIAISLSVVDRTTKIVLGNPPTIAHVLDSILSNAIRVAPEHSSIEVELATTEAVGTAPPRSGQPEPFESVTTVTVRANAAPSKVGFEDWFSKYPVSVRRMSNGDQARIPSLYLAQKMARSVGAELTAETDQPQNRTLIRLALPIPLELRAE